MSKEHKGFKGRGYYDDLRRAVEGEMEMAMTMEVG